MAHQGVLWCVFMNVLYCNLYMIPSSSIILGDMFSFEDNLKT